MQEYFVDLHVHIGRTWRGRAVKITASKNLTLTNILEYAEHPKGLDIVGVIDCHSPEVIEELESLHETGEITELEDGGFRYHNGVTLLSGCEIEINDEKCKGPIHALCYLPNLVSLKEFSHWLAQRVTNIHLSTQRVYEQAREIQKKVQQLNGLFVPAHVFTPFKSLYGKGVTSSLTEVFDPNMIHAIELGLSANTSMANTITELAPYCFLSNSDAHSLPKLAREYQVMVMRNPSFAELKMVFANQDGRGIKENYGLDPFLGKYYETTCESCGKIVEDSAPSCSNCDTTKKIRGVKHRIAELATVYEGKVRPRYINQIPLEFIPGLGNKTLEKLYNYFGSEMNILHRVSEEELKSVIPLNLAQKIIKAREGKLQFNAGGGGKYGTVKLD